ncbi:hypothetical protein HELRODRAFT_190751 [Helobdella robusta]|uniref:Sodium/potassium-transporting ATPase subunit beta n=1 Tax=Helobdella robusta TaxID=6412 RepID=T1FS95_HELRO|nr:hypothetical protein HELRODRAFT_190751 [Helobdella robusta]ESO08497.1 hypothetical protein HELRODRAFT_190751 [Helobdella robusta]
MSSNDEEKSAPGRRERLRKKWEETKKIIWNSEKKEFFGRGGRSWARIVVYNSFYYLGVAGYFALCFAIFSTSINKDIPTLRNYISALKYSPALNFYPRPTSDSTLLRMKMNDTNSYNTYVQMISSQIQAYSNMSESNAINNRNNVTLNCVDGVVATYGQACSFDLPSYLDTTPANILVPSNNSNNCWQDGDISSFGYSEGSPCVMLRINRIFDWDPKPLTFDKTNYGCDGSKDTSKACEFEKVSSYLKSGVAEGYIPVSCEGESDQDADYLLNATFNPPYGFPVSFFPYFKQPSYTSPPVMAQLTTVPGVLVMVWCRFWTNFVKHDVTDHQASVHIEVYVDGKKDSPTTSTVVEVATTNIKPSSTTVVEVPTTAIKLAANTTVVAAPTTASVPITVIGNITTNATDQTASTTPASKANGNATNSNL